MNSKLPGFDNPPVVEVVMGVQFQPLEKLLVPHFGIFWESVRQDYSECRENPPIVPQIEVPTEPGGIKPLRLQASNLPPLPRVFFERPDGEWLIQLQRDRFLHNWRASSPSSLYPRYPAVRQEFMTQWKNFEKFADENGLGEIKKTQLEMTYLNHISPWSEASPLDDVFPDFRWRGGERKLNRPEAFDISLAFTFDDEPDRLRVVIKPGIHSEKGRILVLEFTVRGAPQESDNDILNWFDAARQRIVTAFADLTSQKWQEKWGRVE